jgi:type II secretory pathway pseudopilin PulG
MTNPPMDRTRPPSHHLAAFTLTELLVVIGVIAILIGVLLPVIGRVRRSVYIADTENEISQISNACNAYYSTYRAYPGPFSNYQTQWGGGFPGGADNGTLTEGTNLNTFFFTDDGTKTFPAIPNPKFGTGPSVTGAENLVLGLLGGLRINPNNPASTNIAFVPSEVGLGPMSLNPLNPSRQPPFFTTGSTYLMWCEKGSGGIYQTTTYNANDQLVSFTDGANNQGADSGIPEFVDRFPSPGPLPILYLRARVGGKGVISGRSNGQFDPSITSGGVPAQYQYDIRDIINYTNPAMCANPTMTNGTSTPTPVGLQNLNMTPNNIHDLGEIETESWPATGPPPVVKAGPQNPNPGSLQTTNSFDAFAYFVNRQMTPTNLSSPDYINYSAKPRAVDQFILISAGPDGIYGTTDDITSFGDVSQ